MDKTLDALMIRIAQGDNAAFDAFYRQTAKGAMAFAYSYLRNRADAEDVVQDVYLTVKRKAYTYRHGTNAQAWLLQIVKNKALDELRRRKRTREWMAEDETVIEQTIHVDERPSAVEELLRCLTDEEREIVILHVLWGMKHREIAQQLGHPLGTVTWKYNAALAKIRALKEEQ